MLPDEIRNGHGERLACTWVPGRPGARDMVVIGHGVTSDKDRPWSEALSTRLAAAGVASVRIAFSGNGASEGRFVDSTITKEVADLGSVLDALEGHRLSYVGHSMGGAVGALRAAQDDRIHALVSLAAVTHTAEFVQRMFGQLSPGDLMLDKPDCPFGLALREDLLAIESITPNAAAIKAPWLLVHGTQDEVVPLQHSHDLHAAANTTELAILENVDHSFTGTGQAPLVEAVVPWLLRQLEPA
jgi:pimeloyl-ACP methyl ester carboxylesterase